jgi:hypothetical protein
MRPCRALQWIRNKFAGSTISARLCNVGLDPRVTDALPDRYLDGPIAAFGAGAAIRATVYGVLAIAAEMERPDRS